nr:MAG TPA: hypothetical protein [Caudoviricetes sp.]
MYLLVSAIKDHNENLNLQIVNVCVIKTILT